jgi:hypothetical protein
MSSARLVACIIEDSFVGKPEGKRSLLRPRRRWDGGIRMDLREIGWEGMRWIHLIQVRDQWRAVVSTVMNLRVMLPQSYSLTVEIRH